jgi:hypothetical protein
MYSSNYSDRIAIWGSNYAYDKIGMYSSNYSDKIGMWSSNYDYDKIGMYSSNYSDKIGMWSSNYARDKIGIFSSNYTELYGVWSSNYARDKIGIFSSNYTELYGGWSSNYARDKVGIWGSNYTERLIAGLGTSTNYWTTDGATNIYLNQTGNVGIGTQTSLTNKLQVQGTMSASGLITGNAGITVPSGQTLTSAGTLTTSVINASGLITATNATVGTTDRLNIQYDTRNGIRIQQRYIDVDDVKYDLIQKVANVDKTRSLSFNNGNVEIGTKYWANIPGTFILSAYGNAFVNNTLSFGSATRGIGGLGDYPCNKINFYPSTGYGSGMGTYNGDTEYFTGGLYGSGAHAFYTGASDTSFGTERMRIVGSTGNIGIGTTDPPGYKLNVNGTTFFNGRISHNTRYRPDDNFPCNKMNLWGSDGAYGFGIDGGTLDYFAGSTHRWFYGSGGTSYGTQGMTLTNGNLSVSGSIYATTTIQASGAIYTAVDLWNKSNDGKDRLYYANNGGSYIKSGTISGRMITFRNGSDVDIGYFESNIFYCYGPINLSDRRIKRDIVEINDETALNMLLQVQPTTYYYRDEARNRGNGKVYGFIAQQIKEVIPDAVHTTQDIIANIYKTCLIYNKREIYHSIPQDVAIDTEVHILDKEGSEKGKCYKIKEIYDDYFVIDEDIDGDDCFVFGYMVDDLNGLDKSYIYTLNVCATQELHRRMEAQNVIIKSQDDRIKELEAKVERLLNYISI